MTADAWVNTGALLNRMNFAVQLSSGGQPQRAVGAGRGGQPGTPGGRRLAWDDRDSRRAPFQPALRPAQLARMPIQVDLAAIAPDTSDASREA